MKLIKFIATAVLAMATAMVSVTVAARSFNISVKTETLQGQPGYLALDFINGDGAVGNTVSISALSTDAVLGPLQLSGDASGNLISSPLLLADGAFFNAALQSIVFGTTIDFQIIVSTESPLGPTPDSFSFFILDENQAPFATTDPTGADALFVVDITGAGAAPQVFLSEHATVSVDGQFEIAEVLAEPDVLWPPNGKMVPVSLTVVAESGEVPGDTCEITAVSSDEPPVEDDFELTGPLALELRARRLGSGDGRVYNVEVTCEGAAGDVPASAEVRVPHDQGN